MGPAGIACQGYMALGGKNPATGLEATAAERVMFGAQAVLNGMGVVGVMSAGSGVAVKPSTSGLVSGETKVVGTGAAAANDESFAVLSSGASGETKVVGGEAAAANDGAFTPPLLDDVGAKGASADAAAGQAVPGAANFMGESDQFFKNVSKRSDIDSNGYFDVIAHGSTQKIEVVTPGGTIMADQRVVSRLIENNPAYSGQPIRLLSCDTGACDAGFAQSLANKMGVSVKAPTNLVWAYGDGRMVVAPRSPSNPNFPDLSNQGEFKIFNLGKP